MLPGQKTLEMQAHVQPQSDDTSDNLRWEQIQEIYKEKDFDLLLRDLRGVSPLQRERAAKKLRDYGSLAMEPLCLALHDKDFNVRAAAAESLGHLGDGCAVQPLMEALRECFVGRSARWQLAAGLMSLLAVLVATAGNMAGNIWGPFVLRVILGTVGALLYGGVLCSVLVYYSSRLSQSKICRAITEALVRIAEHNPAPELRNILPDLKAITADILQHEKRTRVASRQAAQRIEALTEQLKSLPLPASAPTPDAATLPRTADAPAPKTETLPRV